MQAFSIHSGLVAPLDRANVDTDAIIPKQFLTSIARTGFGDNLFDEWRYCDRGEPGRDCARRPKRADFVLNLPRYQGASVLLTRGNFGCGSSREHAAWALQQFGFRAILAPSFGDIFHQNALKNGLLLVMLPEDKIDRLFQRTLQELPPLRLTINLERQSIHLEGEEDELARFEIDAFRRRCLLEGLDDVAITLGQQETIQKFEQEHWMHFPWLRGEITALAP